MTKFLSQSVVVAKNRTMGKITSVVVVRIFYAIFFIMCHFALIFLAVNLIIVVI